MDWKKVINYLIYLFLFLLPWQTRLILRHGLLNGGSWEYGTIGIYATELILWLIFFIIIFTESKFFSFNFFRKNKNSFLIVIFLFVVNFFVAGDKLIWLQQVIHGLDAIFVYYLLTKFLVNPIKGIYFFLAGMFLSSCLGIYQFLSQSTFASRFLGLTIHDPFMAGTSILEQVGGRWLRAYGTFQHPNIFGGFLAISILLIFVLVKSPQSKLLKIITKILFVFFSFALFFSFSRSAILGLFIASFLYLVFYYQTIYFKKIAYYFIFGILIFTILAGIYRPLIWGRATGQGRLEQQSISERESSYSGAWNLFKSQPIFGTGFGNYTLSLYKNDKQKNVWDYQPVHNAFVLVISEIGILGVVLFVIFLKTIVIKMKTDKKTKSIIFSFVVLLVILGCLDHYLYSLYPGLMLLSVGLGLSFLGSKNA